MEIAILIVVGFAFAAMVFVLSPAFRPTLTRINKIYIARKNRGLPAGPQRTALRGKAMPVSNPLAKFRDPTAKVYALTPAYRDREGNEVDYVVASAVDLPNLGGGYRNQETMLFPSDGIGITAWDDIAVVNTKSHEAALAAIGYRIGY